MKKIFKLLVLVFLMLFCINTKAKELEEKEYKNYNVKRGYIVCNYVFDISKYNPTLKDLLLASQSCPIDDVSIYEIKYSEDINGNATSSYRELLDSKELTKFPNLDISYIFYGDIKPKNHDKENKLVIANNENNSNNENNNTDTSPLHLVRFNVGEDARVLVPTDVIPIGWVWSTLRYSKSYLTNNYSLIVKNGETYGDAAEVKGQLGVGVKDGYFFDGWYTRINGQGDLITANTVVNLTSDIELYAKWANSVNFKIKVIGINENPELIDYSLKEGSTIADLKENYQGFSSTDLYQLDGIYKEEALTNKYNDNYVIKNGETYYIYYREKIVNIYSRVVGNGTIELSKNTLSGSGDNHTFVIDLHPNSGYQASTVKRCYGSYNANENDCETYEISIYSDSQYISYSDENQRDVYVTVTFVEEPTYHVYLKTVGEGETTLSVETFKYSSYPGIHIYYQPSDGYIASTINECFLDFDTNCRLYGTSLNKMGGDYFEDSPRSSDVYITVTYKPYDELVSTYLSDDKIEINCSEIKDATYMSRFLFSTPDNKLYRYNTNGLYSNNKNCIEIEKTVLNDDTHPIGNIVGIYSTGFADDNKNVYLYSDSSYSTKGITYSHTYTFDYDNWFYKYEGMGDFLLIKDNGNYYFQPYYEDGDLVPVNTNFASDEEVLYINGGIVKTNKKYYTIAWEITNKDECQYLDIGCVGGYFIREIKDLSHYYDQIATISSHSVSVNMNYSFRSEIYIVDKEGNYYSKMLEIEQ